MAYVSSKNIIDKLEKNKNGQFNFETREIEKIKDALNKDTAKGKWNKGGTAKSWKLVCPFCEEVAYYYPKSDGKVPYNYCPFCGQHIKGVRESE